MDRRKLLGYAINLLPLAAIINSARDDYYRRQNKSDLFAETVPYSIMFDIYWISVERDYSQTNELCCQH